jgi:hypothetical protein
MAAYHLSEYEDRRKQQITQLKKAADAGRDALESHPDFPRVHLHAMEAQESLLNTLDLPSPAMPSPERLDAAIKILDVWAGAYVQLVTNLADQKSFMAFLRGLDRHAWEVYRGIAEIEPIPGNKVRESIRIRCAHWEKESYRRLIPASASVDALSTRKGYRAEVRAWMRRHGISSVREAAKKLAVGYDILKNIMSDQGDTRYSADTLKDVLAKITDGPKR